MKLDVSMRGPALADVPAWARRAEHLGVDGIFTTETNHDPFLPLALAAEHTDRVELGTGIALAFPRSPMTLAYQAWDLHDLARGRFVLGLGAQVRAHVVRRFSAQYEHPARRMRELCTAVRAIWEAWATGGDLDVRGEFYTHTLMPPAFRPGPARYGLPRLWLAGVKEGMVEVAGEVADGLLVHPLQTERYLRDTLAPALQRGLQRAGRRREDLEVSVALFAVGSDGEREDVRRRIAFYGSTPAYRHVLEAHGWEQLGAQLHELSRTGGWDRMAALVPDEVVETVAVCGSTPDEIVARVHERYRGIADRVNLHAGDRVDLDAWAPLIGAFAAARAPAGRSSVRR